jgi:hypothetical protein
MSSFQDPHFLRVVTLANCTGFIRPKQLPAFSAATPLNVYSLEAAIEFDSNSFQSEMFQILS